MPAEFPGRHYPRAAEVIRLPVSTLDGRAEARWPTSAGAELSDCSRPNKQSLILRPAPGGLTLEARGAEACRSMVPGLNGNIINQGPQLGVGH